MNNAGTPMETLYTRSRLLGLGIGGMNNLEGVACISGVGQGHAHLCYVCIPFIEHNWNS